MLPAATGALWLWWVAQSGFLGVLLGGLPGMLLLAAGLSNLLWAGDARIFHFMSFGALLGVVLSFPAVLVFGPLAALVVLIGSAVSFVAAGYLAVGQEPVPEGVPEPRMGPGMAARAAEDEFSMCTIVPGGDEACGRENQEHRRGYRAKRQDRGEGEQHPQERPEGHEVEDARVPGPEQV